MLLVFQLIVASAIHVAGWSAPAHRLVAKEASKRLSDQTQAFIAAHLHSDMSSIPRGLSLVERVGEGMAEVSTWADTVRESREYHYTHTLFRDCKPFDRARDCPSGRCLSSGIARYMAEASDARLPGQQRAEAIKFLIHLVADATQPLHTGFKKDVGGLFLAVLSPVETSLHRFWDLDLVSYAIESGMSLSKEPMNPLPDDVMDSLTAGDWIVSKTIETATCSKAYVDHIGDWMKSSTSLSLEYLDDRAVVAMKQLGRAAAYLAQILNKVEARFSESRLELRRMSQTSPSPVTQTPANRFGLLESREEEEKNDVEGPEDDAPIRTTTTRKPKEISSNYNGFDLKKIPFAVGGDLIVVGSMTLLDESYSGLMVSGQCIFRNRPTEIFKLKMDVDSLEKYPLKDYGFIEALLHYHMGSEVEMFVPHQLWPTLASRAKSLGLEVCEISQGGEGSPSKSRPKTNEYSGSARYVVAAWNEDFVVGLIETNQQSWNKFRFNIYLGDDSDGKRPGLLLLQSTEDDEVDVGDPNAFIYGLMMSDEAVLEKGHEVLKRNLSLKRLMFLLRDLYSEIPENSQVPSNFKRLTRIDRSHDKPWLETIEMEIDPKAEAIAMSDLVVIKMTGDLVFITTRKLMAEDALASKLCFHRIPAIIPQYDTFIDWRLLRNNEFDNLNDVSYAQALRMIVPIQKLKAGRGGRAIQELDGMLNPRGGTRFVTHRYKILRQGDTIMASLYTKSLKK